MVRTRKTSATPRPSAAVGPWGALAGAAAGGAIHYASKGQAKRGPAAPSRGASLPAPASAPASQPGAVSPSAGISPTATPPAPVPAPAPAQGPGQTPVSVNGSSAAAQLLRLIQDPRLLQACAALVPGQLGVREIQVNGVAAPPAAFLNLVSVLALEAAQQAPAPETPVDGYLKGPDGQYAVDVASPSARARALLERLQAVAPVVQAAPVGGSGPAGAAEAWLLESGMAELV